MSIDWPGAWRGGWPGVTAIVGDVGSLREPIPEPSPRDLADIGARSGQAAESFLHRRGILRLVVGRRLGLPPATVALGYAASGAPALLAAQGTPPATLFVSVASRGRLAALALAGTPVGIDIEPLSDPGPLDAVLTPRERAALATAAPAARAVMALQYWTAKEAYLKALGTGLRRDPASIAIEAQAEGAFMVRDAGRRGAGRGVWFAPPSVAAGAVMALWAMEGDTA